MFSPQPSSTGFLPRNGWAGLRWVFWPGIAALAVASLAVGLWGGSYILPLPAQIAIVGMLLLVAAVVVRRSRLRLFGPVVLYDSVRLARRKRYIWLRVLYAIALLALLSWQYHNFELRPVGFVSTLVVRAPPMTRPGMKPPPPPVIGFTTTIINPLPYHPAAGELARMSEFAQSFFYFFLCAQLLLVLLLTPAYVAGAIAEEKQKRTLDFLLATDLRDREVVLGKLVSRSLNLALLVLTGLPILSFVQFLGGVDPNLLLAGYAATGLTLAGLAGLSILNSVYAKRGRDAIILSYLAAIAYVGLSFLIQFLLKSPPSAATAPGAGKTLGEYFLGWLNAGNPVYAVLCLRAALNAGESLASAIPGLLLKYAIFHGLLAFLCCALAVGRLRLRAVAPEADNEAGTDMVDGWQTNRSVGDRPVLWKEIFVEPGMSFNWFGRIILAAIVLTSFLSAAWIGYQVMRDAKRAPPFLTQPDFSGMLARAINQWVRVVGTSVACLTLLGVAFRAASSITSERERQTFDSLLVTPLESGSILWGKWLGCILGPRWAWLWLLAVWCVGLGCGGLNIVIMPWLFLACAVYAAFLASLGLYFSTVKRSGLQATVWTLALCIVLSFGHWLPWCVAGYTPPNQYGSGPLWTAAGTTALGSFQTYGLAPPVTLAWLSFHGDQVGLPYLRRAWDTEWENFVAIMEGLVCWVIATAVLLEITRRRFRLAIGRTDRASVEFGDWRSDGPRGPRRKREGESQESVTTIEPFRSSPYL